MENIVNLIGSLGFPIVASLGLGYMIWNIFKKSTKREEKLLEEITQNRIVNAKAIETISKYAERLTNIETTIVEVKEDVVEIKEKIKQE